MKNIAIVTPLKNEVNNIELLFKAVSNQMHVFQWIILENDSDDGSKEMLKRMKKPSNVQHLEIFNLELEDKEYRLGAKYSGIVNRGFTHIQNKSYYNSIDYIGILDSDCFPEPSYYSKLVSFMEADPALGISSGLIYDTSGKSDLSNLSWVRGGCRLWKKSCFDEVGYFVGPSADTLSVCKATLKGWKVYPNKDISVTSRALGNRVNFSYYGYSAYYRGHTFTYALLKTMKLLFNLEAKKAYQFFVGYFKSFFHREERIRDKQVLKYYRFYLLKKFLRIFTDNE